MADLMAREPVPLTFDNNSTPTADQQQQTIDSFVRMASNNTTTGGGKTTVLQPPMPLSVPGEDAPTFVNGGTVSSPADAGSPLQTATTATRGTAGTTNRRLPDKLDWRVFTSPAVFDRYLSFSPMDPAKKQAFPLANLNCNVKKWNEDHPTNPVKLHMGRVSFEGPAMKCISGLQESEKYQNDFSMRFSMRDARQDENVPKFNDFMVMLNEWANKQLVAHGYEWMKDVDSDQAKAHIIVRAKTEDIYQNAAVYTPERYAADIAKTVNTPLKVNERDGVVENLFQCKVYPQDHDKQTPNVTLFNEKNEQVDYPRCELAHNETKYKCYVRPHFQLPGWRFVLGGLHFKAVVDKLKYVVVDNGDKNDLKDDEVLCDFEGTNEPVVQKRKFLPAESTVPAVKAESTGQNNSASGGGSGGANKKTKTYGGGSKNTKVYDD